MATFNVNNVNDGNIQTVSINHRRGAPRRMVSPDRYIHREISIVVFIGLALFTAGIHCFIVGAYTVHRVSRIIGAHVLFAAVFYVFGWRCYIHPYYWSELRHIPTVPGCPIWGQFFDIITEECGVPQRRWHHQYGPYIRYFFPFGAERLSIAGEEGLRHMTQRNPYNYPKPVRAKKWMERILGEGVLLAEGETHALQRKALAPAFSGPGIRALTPVFWEKAVLMSKVWKESFERQNKKVLSVEVLDWLNRCTLDIIGKAGFGYEINSLTERNNNVRRAYQLVFNFSPSARIQHGVQAFWPVTKHLPTQMNRDVEEARSIIIDKAMEILNARLNEAENNRGGKDILTLIARENKNIKASGEEGLSFDEMRDQVMTFLGAGHDTTATAVTWALHLLAQHPEVQEKLREEIRKHFFFLFEETTRNDPKNWYHDPHKLPYLEKVCRESLRFIPPIPMTVRQTVTDDQIGPYFIPKGTVIYMLANVTNRLKDFWGPTADEFNPDRWDELPDTAQGHAYFTFLAGPRSCIGRKFAETEMKILLCALLSKYEFYPNFEWEDPEEHKMWRLVLRPLEGVHLHAKILEN